jgi:hypothetical protein
MANDKTYRRGQVEWALWQFATIEFNTGENAQKDLRIRLKHLLEIDREGAPFGKEVFRRARVHALSSSAPEGTGVDIDFSAFDAFCIAIALDLLRTGFKQSEVMILMGRIRGLLEQPFQQILENPPPRRPHGNKVEPQPARHADRHVFLVVERVEASERHAEYATGKYARVPLNIEPRVFVGVPALSDYMATMDHVFRRAIVVEIAQIAARLTEFLEKAPKISRGRSRK